MSYYTDLSRTRKPNSLALTIANKEDGNFVFGKNSFANTEVVVWDVTNNHHFYKNKNAAKPCSKNNCDCDGNTEETYLMVTLFREGARGPVLCKLSNHFFIRSSKRKQMAEEKAKKANASSLLPGGQTPPSNTPILSPITAPPNSWSFTSLPNFTLPRAFAYHTINLTENFIVLFGGRSTTGGLFGKFKPSESPLLTNEVWILNKNKYVEGADCSWTLCNIEGPQPEPRFAHTAVTISSNQVMIFGGEGDGKTLNDVWILQIEKENQGVWKQVILDEKDPRPSPRSGHTAIYGNMKGRRAVIIFGGYAERLSLDETWVLFLGDGAKGKWFQIQKKGPLSRYYHSAVVHEKKMVIFGGCNRRLSPSDPNERILQWLNDIWTFDLDELVWQQVNPLSELAPKPRDGHFCTMLEGKLVIVGGWIGQIKLNQAIQSLANKSEENILGSGREEEGNEVLNSPKVSGLQMLEKLPDASFTNDMWSYDFQTNTWSLINFVLKPTGFGHAAGFTKDSTITLFGGEVFPPSVVANGFKLFRV